MSAVGEYAPLTGSGAAAIACIEASGDALAAFLERHIRAQRSDVATWHAGDVLRATLIDGDSPIDDIIITVHQVEPKLSVRLHLHGGPWIARRCFELLASAGLRERADESDPRLPLDEFIDAEMHRVLPRVLTLDGAKWLVRQATLLRESVADAMVLSDPKQRATRLQELSAGAARLRLYTEPYRVVLVGAPNAGKSTLFNALAGEAASIVSEIPGTTRDWVEAPGEVGGFPVTWIDTAGIREAADAIEAEGIERTRRLIESSDAVMLLVDPAMEPVEVSELTPERSPDVVVYTKADLQLGRDANRTEPRRRDAIHASALNGQGIEQIKQFLADKIGFGSSFDSPGAFTDAIASRLSAMCRNP